MPIFISKGQPDIIDKKSVEGNKRTKEKNGTDLNNKEKIIERGAFILEENDLDDLFNLKLYRTKTVLDGDKEVKSTVLIGDNLFGHLFNKEKNLIDTILNDEKEKANERPDLVKEISDIAKNTVVPKAESELIKNLKLSEKRIMKMKAGNSIENDLASFPVDDILDWVVIILLILEIEDKSFNFFFNLIIRSECHSETQIVY
jgi:hypothetical protein